MNRRFVLVMAGAALSFGLVVSTAQAAPAGLAPLKETATSGNLVGKTHGWHRRCVRYRGWRHRHVRRGAVSCRPRWRWRRYRHCFIDRRGLRICVWRRRR
ncbi:MAG: hypothetical protein KJZ80_04985 [Hyphomicrobiaceae bacterium]|nr:hypothetical protein [Hyphomicrobiaceae bacterium]